MLTNEVPDGEKLVLRLEKSRLASFLIVTLQIVAMILMIAWLDYNEFEGFSLVWKIAIGFASYVVLFLLYIFVDNGRFIRVEVFTSGLFVSRLFRNSNWLSFRELKDVHATNLLGNGLRPRLNFEYKDSKKNFTFQHSFKNTQIEQVLQYLSDAGVNVVTHYLRN